MQFLFKGSDWNSVRFEHAQGFQYAFHLRPLALLPWYGEVPRPGSDTDAVTFCAV